MEQPVALPHCNAKIAPKTAMTLGRTRPHRSGAEDWPPLHAAPTPPASQYILPLVFAPGDPDHDRITGVKDSAMVFPKFLRTKRAPTGVEGASGLQNPSPPQKNRNLNEHRLCKHEM